MSEKSEWYYASVRMRKSLKRAILTYAKAQLEILGRKQNFTQIVTDAIVEKLTREGFLPDFIGVEEIEPGEILFDPDTDDRVRPWQED